MDNRITEMAGRYSATYPAAMKCLLTDREGLTAYLRFLVSTTTAPASKLHRADLRRDPPPDEVIGRLPGESSCLSLVWAVLDRASAAGAA